MLINKIDLLEAVGCVDFNMERAKRDAMKLNKDIKIFPVGAKSGEGLSGWYDWLREAVGKQ